MQTDARMARLRARVAVVRHNDLGTEEFAQKGDGGRMGDQLGYGAAHELDFGPPALVDTVAHRFGFPLGGLGLEPGDVVGAQEVGQNQIAFDLNLTDALAQG